MPTLHLCRQLATLAVGLALAGTSAAYSVYGAIGDKYTALGRNTGALGPPESDEAGIDHGGRFNRFRHGFIVWHPQTGAHGVWGAIGAKWDTLGRVAYGYPITDESVTPDRRGRYNHFRALHLPGKPEASIYWTPQTGAQAIYGEIRRVWAANGWERGPLGYPTSDEFQDGPYRRSNFENGYIRWNAAQGARITLHGQHLPPPPPGTFGSLRVDGLVIAHEGARVGGDAQALGENRLCGQWEQRVGTLNRPALDAIAAAARPHMNGFGFHSKSAMSLSPVCSARAEVFQACSKRIVVRMAVPGNRFDAQLTTPTPLGSWADPTFRVSFDIEARTEIELPSSQGQRIRIANSTQRVHNVRREATNLSGDIALAVASVVRSFGGPDILRALTQDRQLALPGVALALPEMPPVPPGLRVESCVDGRTMVLGLTRRPVPLAPGIRLH